MQRDATAESPLRVFGAMLRHYRVAAGLTPEELGARIYLSASQIRKVEEGTRTPTEALTQACEALPELNCNGALTTLREILKDHLRHRAYPGWFQAWPDHESHARRLRNFELVVVPGLLQTEAYARAILSTRVGATEEELDEAVAARLERQQILDREHPPELWVLHGRGGAQTPGRRSASHGRTVGVPGCRSSATAYRHPGHPASCWSPRRHARRSLRPRRLSKRPEPRLPGHRREPARSSKTQIR